MIKTDVTKWSGILVYLECYKGKIHPVSLELIGEAERLSRIFGGSIFAMGIGADMQNIKLRLKGYPVEKLYLFETEDEYDPILYESIAADCIKNVMPSVVLFGGTYEGRALAPRLSVEFGTGLTADCTELDIDPEGNLVQTRPAFGGNVMASIITKESRPQFATVRPGVMELPVKQECKNMEIVVESIVKEKGPIEICSVKPIIETGHITQQDLLVVAGRGVRKKEDLDMLRELAALLGGTLASSRALVEKGYMSPKEQIGLSGNSVNPKYMLTFGVSGTVQFAAGMKHTKNIIAVNNDPNARIFQVAHYPICGDLYEIVPLMIEKLKKNIKEK